MEMLAVESKLESMLAAVTNKNIEISILKIN